MEFHDWCQWFTHASVCRIVNTRVLSLQKTWHEGVFSGRWVGRTAGGSVNNRETFLHNPQVFIHKHNYYVHLLNIHVGVNFSY